MPKIIFNGCNKLKVIKFNDNVINILNKELFSGCKESLEEIDFSFNEIDDLPKDLFKGCKNLMSIDFKNNKLK